MKLARLVFIGAVVMSLAFSLSVLAVEYSEAPMLAEKVAEGSLPPLEERLPEEPYVVEPVERIGKYGGTANIASIGGWADQMHFNSFVGFLKPTVTGDDLVPYFAKEVTSSEDKRTWTIHFRKGVKWSNGDPFSADDILFWYEDMLQNEDLTPTIGEPWMTDGKLVEVKKIDEVTVEFQFPYPRPYFTSHLFHDIGWSMLYPSTYLKQFHINYVDEEKLLAEARAAGFDAWYEYFWDRERTDQQIPAQPERPGLTPFIMVEDASDHQVYERNPYYWKVDTAGNQLPYIDRLYVDLVADRQVYNGMVISGQLDFAGHFTDVRDYPLYRRYEGEGDYRTLLWDSGMGSEVIYMVNMTHQDPELRKIFQDVRFRRALSLGINREEISDVLYFGRAEPRQWTVLEGSVFFEPEFAQAYTEFDPERANRLLDEMGLDKRDGEGYRLRPDGRRLLFTIEYYDTETPKQPNVELVAQQWQELGLDVRYRSISGELQSERAPANLMDATVWHGDKATDLLFPINPSFIVPFPPGWERTNWPLWGRWVATNGEGGEEPPEEIKQLRLWWEEMVREPNLDRRVELGKNILRSQAENLWVIGTVGHAPWPIIAKNYLRNVPEWGMWGWDTGYMTNMDPEQFFFDR